MKKILESGALGLGTAVLAKNPDLLRGFGVLGNVAANKLDDKDKEKEAEAAAASGMKKGGMVSASKRADGCVKRGKTRGKMV
jgi:hypothetical protein